MEHRGVAAVVAGAGEASWEEDRWEGGDRAAVAEAMEAVAMPAGPEVVWEAAGGALAAMGVEVVAAVAEVDLGVEEDASSEAEVEAAAEAEVVAAAPHHRIPRSTISTVSYRSSASRWVGL